MVVNRILINHQRLSEVEPNYSRTEQKYLTAVVADRYTCGVLIARATMGKELCRD
jgi:hypothetical protein